MTDQELVERFLDSTHTTLWGQSFNVKDKATRKLAAAWFLKEMEALDNYMSEQGVYDNDR